MKFLNPLFITLITAMTLLSSCDWKTAKSGDAIVLARVNDKVLTWDEMKLRGFVAPNDSLDSIAVVTRYVNRWVKNQLLLSRAEFNLPDQQKQFDFQIEDYRRDLIIYAYQQAFLNENLDTNISAEEIQKYYEENGSQFRLKENIFRTEYAVFPTDAPKVSELRSLFFSSRQQDRDRFLSYAVQSATMFSLEDTAWMSVSDLARDFPIVLENQNDFLAGKKKIRFSDDQNVYFFNVLEYKLKETEAPVTYVESTIRSILLNKRKLEVLDNLEHKIFKDGLSKNVAEIFL
jgi:hypothetical protein